MHTVLTVQLLNSRLVGGLFFLPSEMYPWFYLNCRDNFKLFESTSSLCGVLKKCFVAEEQWVKMNNWIQKVVKHFIPACLHFFSPLYHQWWSLPFKRNAKCTEIPFTGHATTLAAPSKNLKKCFFLSQWKFTIHVERLVSAEAPHLDLLKK